MRSTLVKETNVEDHLILVYFNIQSREPFVQIEGNVAGGLAKKDNLSMQIITLSLNLDFFLHFKRGLFCLEIDEKKRPSY
jgi:hypothetical protein